MQRLAGLTRSRIASFVRRHRVFLALAVVGTGLRIVTAIAYDPALLRPDSVTYLRFASTALTPWGFHPIGYPSFLRILPFDWTIAVVPVVQHILGLGIAVIIYMTLDRLEVRRWLAAAAAAPTLLDAYQLNIEQYILAEALFELLIVGGCAALLWRRPLGIGAAALAGLLLAGAALTRSIGTVAILPALIAAGTLAGGLSLRARLARPAVVLALFALPLLGYAAWFNSVHGSFTLTTYGGRFLYGRVISFADCGKFEVPRWERVLCPQAPPGERKPANDFMWGRDTSPFYRLEPPLGMTPLEVVGNFSNRVVRAQPIDYLEAVGSDFLRTFGPVKESGRDDVPLGRWKFGPTYLDPGSPDWTFQSAADYRSTYAVRQAEPGLSGFLSGYQRFAYTWGPLLAIALLAALLAVGGVGRAKDSGLRTAAFLFATTGLLLSLGAIAATLFSWRYQLLQVVLLPPAGALGITALLGLEERADSQTRDSAPPGDAFYRS